MCVVTSVLFYCQSTLSVVGVGLQEACEHTTSGVVVTRVQLVRNGRMTLF